MADYVCCIRNVIEYQGDTTGEVYFTFIAVHLQENAVNKEVEQILLKHESGTVMGFDTTSADVHFYPRPNGEKLYFIKLDRIIPEGTYTFVICLDDGTVATQDFVKPPLIFPNPTPDLSLLQPANDSTAMAGDIVFSCIPFDDPLYLYAAVKVVRREEPLSTFALGGGTLGDEITMTLPPGKYYWTLQFWDAEKIEDVKHQIILPKYRLVVE